LATSTSYEAPRMQFPPISCHILKRYFVYEQNALTNTQ
jgi:hypothetical protein